MPGKRPDPLARAADLEARAAALRLKAEGTQALAHGNLPEKAERARRAIQALCRYMGQEGRDNAILTDAIDECLRLRRIGLPEAK